MGLTTYDKPWDSHVVHLEEDGTALLYMDRHLVHEVTSPQAYEGLKVAGRKPWRVDSVVATADHNTPTTGWDEGVESIDRKSTRLNSSHQIISYAVFCLKKKKECLINRIYHNHAY